MLARVDGAKWGAPYVANKPATCQPRTTFENSAHVTNRWSFHCASTAGGLIEESFFYMIGRSFSNLLHRVDVHPEALSPDVTRALRERLTKRFGASTHEPEVAEIGFRRPRSGLPVAGDQWVSSNLHYFLLQNPIGGGRKGVKLIVLDARLFNERERDEFVQEAAGLADPGPPARPFLQQLLGDPYIRLIDADPKTPSERQSLAEQTSSEALGLLGIASRALLDERAMLLLAANGLVAELSTLLWVIDEKGEHEIPAAAPIRAQLAKFGVKLSGMLHDNGVLAYHQDLLWRVWREFPDSQAGQLAFVELQQRGWYTNPGIGCPANPDLFRDVIEHGEAFLAQHPTTQFRKEVLFTLAVANESWWSIARAPADDGWVGEVPYPRKDINKRQAAAARERAINYYQQIVDLSPESPEAASALLRLPRLNMGRDTGQRRFFCSYC
jgi:hypothetical protein